VRAPLPLRGSVPPPREEPLSSPGCARLRHRGRRPGRAGAGPGAGSQRRQYPAAANAAGRPRGQVAQPRAQRVPARLPNLAARISTGLPLPPRVRDHVASALISAAISPAYTCQHTSAADKGPCATGCAAPRSHAVAHASYKRARRSPAASRYGCPHDASASIQAASVTASASSDS
jgi:hypothetical protein